MAFAVALLAGVPGIALHAQGPGPALPGNGPTLPIGPVTVAPAFVPGPGVRSLGPLPADDPIDVAVGLASPDPAGLASRLTLEYAAGSPEEGQFLTAGEVAARYAPSASTYQAAVQYFRDAGASVTVSPDRWMLLVQGPSSTVARAFHTEFDEYAVGGRVFFSHPTASVLPPIAPWDGVLGLGNETPVVPFVTATGAGDAPSGSCSGAEPYSPCAIADAYNVSGFYTAGTNGTGVRVGVVDPYDGQENETRLKSDLASFTTLFGLPHGNVDYLYPVPTSKDLNTTSTGWATEEALDLEWSRASAPGAAIDMTFAPDASAGLYFSVDWLVANQLVNVISLSWAEPDVGAFNTYSTPCASACNATSDGSYDLLHPVLAAAALEGIGVFAASGDCGAAMGTDGVSTSYPASDPDATGVGATDLTLNGLTWGGEVGWSGNDSGATAPGCQNQGGSGGGYSPFPRPYWQAAPGVPATPAERGVPDVSIDGGSPVTIVQDGFTSAASGTSVSTPIWAGLAAVADQLHGGPLGLLAPGLYALARSPSAGTYFHDVTSGDNGYSAGPGWDPVTGIGTPNASALLPALARGAALGPPPAPTLHGLDRIGPAPLTVRFTVSVPAGAPPVAGYDIDFGDGNATWSSNGTVSHRYVSAGAYDPQAEVFYEGGNSSASPPVLVLVGTGAPLSVRLALNVTDPAVGAPVRFSVNVSGGVAPYRFSFDFGDGSYYDNATSASWNHSYGFVGGFCAVVTAADAASPTDGGASLEVPVSVGGAPPPACPERTTLSVTLPPEPTAMDLPANVNLSATPTGGAGPVSYQVVSDDPYVTECQCGIFRVPGNHTLRLFANDSVSDEATAWLNITTYPALTGTFVAGLPNAPYAPSRPPIGEAPLTVEFTANVTGGHNASSNATVWAFGDGSPDATGAIEYHVYTTPGYYVATAVVHDRFNGSAAQAFLVDVLGSGTAGPVGLSASVALGPGAAAGNEVGFAAATNYGSPGVTFDWQLGDNDSAYGYSAFQSYTTGCLAADRCALSVTLNATDSLGTIANVTFALPFPFFGRSSALALTDHLSGAAGTTPYRVDATGATSAMPGAAVTWNFGDGNGTTGTNVSHTYFDPGNYTLVDIAEDTIGDIEVRSHAIAVIGPPIAPLTFTGGPSVLAGVAPLPVEFHANASGGYGGPFTYAWEFGDGSGAAGPWANHTYPVVGNYTANLTITDYRGTTDSAQWEVRAFAATTVLLLLALSSEIVAPGASLWLNVTADALCTPASVTGCSSANVTAAWPRYAENVTCVGAPAGCDRVGAYTLVAPTAVGEYPVWVNASGDYRGSAEALLEVANPGAPSLTPEQLVLLGGGAGGALAVAAIGLAIRRRRPPPVSP